MIETAQDCTLPLEHLPALKIDQTIDRQALDENCLHRFEIISEDSK